MLHFESDYIAGAHPQILKRLTETNFEGLSGYGSDKYTESAKKKIAAACGDETYEVEFLTGGTQTNAVVIASMLKDYEGAVSAVSGHINGHESGAVEYTGHKILPLPAYEGKMKAEDLKELLATFYADPDKDHLVYPGIVYVSHPTEYGTIYSKSELEAIKGVCEEYSIPLFLDGARLGYGLQSLRSDLTLRDIARICDVFYIGGTKVGALCGEAIVFTRKNKPLHFMTSVKKRGALLAKGRLLGVQFDTLFTDNLYFEISKHAILMAEKLKEILAEKGFKFFLDSPTNQQFVIIDNERLRKLQENVCVSVWEKFSDTETVIRFATSWSTTEEDLKKLKALL